MRRHAKALLAATCLAASLPAAAQTIAPTRIVAFGDSYVDSGNVFRISGTPFPAVYPTGRFSGGTNYIDTLEGIFRAPQVNFGIGGALAGPGNTGTNNISSPLLPGFQFEVSSFLGGGGGPFPVVTPSFAATDLLAVSIGGNDARLYELSPGSTVAGAAPRAAVTVADATRGLDALYNAGARNIAFLAGNVGDLPEVRGTSVAAVGTAFSQAFNAGIQAPLARYAAGGALVHYLDLTIVGNNIRADPSAYGLVSAGACTVACVQNPAVSAQFLFYVDQVHLTSAGFAIVAEYVQRQIEAPGLLRAATDIGISSAGAFGRTMRARNDLAVAADEERPLGAYLLAVSDRHDHGAGETSFGYEYDSTGVVGGIEGSFGGAFGGIAASYTRPRVGFEGVDARTRADAYQLGVYGGVKAGGASLRANVGVGRYDYEFRREAVIDRLTAQADGTSLNAGVEASYGFALTDGIKAGPILSVSYARAKIDGYAEEGDAALTLNVDRQKLESLIGRAGLEAHGELDTGGLAVTPYLKATLARQFDGNGATARFTGTSSPAIVNEIRVGEQEEDLFGEVEAGASFDLSGRVAVQVQGVATIERPGGNDYGGFAGVKFRF